MEYAGKREKGILCAVIILFYLTAASCWLTWNVYAKYTMSDFGGDGARVARFEVQESGTATADITAELAPGENYSYEVDVVNKSETAITYKITAENTYNNLPLTFEMYELNGTESVSDDGNGKAVRYGEIAAADGNTRRYALRISWKEEDGSRNPEYAGQADLFRVTLEAAQAD